MFLTFESAQPNKPDDPRNPKKQSTRRSERLNSRRRSTPRACTSCRQRKIRCDGAKPCEACRWYKKDDLCSYPQRERWAGEDLSETSPSPDYKGALGRLFPESVPEDLVDLSREKLLALIAKPTAELQPSQQSQSNQNHDSLTIATSASAETHVSALSIDRPSGLESLHSIPAGGGVGEEEEYHCASASDEDSIEHLSDDVNALSLPARHLTSYLGVSSIRAALKVIAWLHPEVNLYLSNVSVSKDQRHHRQSIDSALQPTELQMIDSYFLNFQPFAPLLDEESCRSTFMSGCRKDDRWQALLNAILSLGSITTAGLDNSNHRVYFSRSMSHLSLNSLGNPSLEVVQTLGLLGGWYCHYFSQPNLSHALMGASVRMAVALGLQREPFDSSGSSQLRMNAARSGHQELRRRVWWSLCCLDTWGHETLGRPNLNFFGPSITVNPPRLLDKENYAKVLPLIENIEFVRIASKIQESLAALPTLSHKEMLNLDSQLLQWRNDLPPVLKDYNPCPESLRTVRTVMRWRFYTQRILLYRPMLLSYAMRQIPLIAIRDEERVAVHKCCEIAQMAIEDISATTLTTGNINQMICWNAVWLMFQATMVPLTFLSACSAYFSAVATNAALVDEDDLTTVEACKAQVETAISTLDRMRPYGLTAERSLAVIQGILDSILNRHGTKPSDTDAEIDDENNIDAPNYAIAEYQPINRDRVLDWTAATTANTTNATFDNFPSQHMWEYLSWSEGNNDIWPELYSNFNPQEGANFFNPT